MYTNSKLAKSIRLALMFGASSAAFGLAGASVAVAQDANEEEAAERVERIQVTGSRIRRTDMETASPVQIISSEDIAAAGYTRIEDLLNELPSVQVGQNAFIANGASGTASLNLRGLGAARTLVLVNGRRLQPGGIYSQSSDVNQIPTSLIERVEVLTGGGSSVYGSDAVAGVVNFVMKDNFQGLEANVGFSGYQHGNDNAYMQERQDAVGFEYPGATGIDGHTFTVDLAGGTTFADGRGHMTVYTTWRKNDEVLQGDRDYSNCALNAFGTACGGSAAAPNPNFFIAPVVGGEVDFSRELLRNLDPNGGFRTYDGGRDAYNFAPINHFMRPNERYTFGSFFEYEVNENFRPYIETNYMHDRTTGQIAESGIFFQTFQFDPTNADVFTPEQIAFFAEEFPDAELVQIDIGKRNNEGGPRQNKLEHNSYRIVAGADGMLTDLWEYDLSFQYGSTQSSTTYINDFYVPALTDRLNAEGGEGCLIDDGCVPYQVFTPGGVTADAANQLGGSAIMTGWTTQRIVSGFVTGEMPFTVPTSMYPVNAVFGFENREVRFERDADTVYQLAQLAGQGGPTNSIIGGYNVKEAYAEFQVPLLEDAPFIRELSLDLGYRYSDYNTSGGVSAYKLGLDWAINDDYKARASMNRAVRAPTVADLFSPQSIGLWSGTDPCAGEEPSATLEQCQLTGMTEAQYGNVVQSPANQNNGIFGGNPDLDPEIADTITVGLVGNPFEGFNFAVDFWDIKVEDGIGTVPASVILQRCIETGDNSFCNAITRGPGGDLWRGTEGFVESTATNVSEQNFSGIDLSANYTLDLMGGTLSTSLVGTYFLKKETTIIPGLDGTSYDCAGIISNQCAPQPEWSHIMSANYTTGGDWSVGARWRYIGGFDYVFNGGAEDQLIGDGVGSMSYVDINANYNINESTSLLVGVNNVLDRSPVIVGDVNSDIGNAMAIHDLLGRYLFAKVTFRF